MTGQSSATVSRAPGLAQRLFEGAMLVITPRDSHLHRFNEVGTFIWQFLEQPRAMRDIADAVAARFAGVTPDQAARDASAFVNQLRRKGLVTVAEE